MRNFVRSLLKKDTTCMWGIFSILTVFPTYLMLLLIRRHGSWRRKMARSWGLVWRLAVFVAGLEMLLSGGSVLRALGFALLFAVSLTTLTSERTRRRGRSETGSGLSVVEKAPPSPTAPPGATSSNTPTVDEQIRQAWDAHYQSRMRSTCDLPTSRSLPVFPPEPPADS
jgi:hypothetical protein